jgi:hypothetical protein
MRIHALTAHSGEIKIAPRSERSKGDVYPIERMISLLDTPFVVKN